MGSMLNMGGWKGKWKKREAGKARAVSGTKVYDGLQTRKQVDGGPAGGV